MRVETRVGELELGTKTARPGALLPELDQLLAKKPNARVAIVQGSFDWFHSGHLDLVRTVANAEIGGPGGKKERFDLVVVTPTDRYDRKAHLAASFERRRDLAEAAISSLPELAGRVVVSDVQKRLPPEEGEAPTCRPTQLMEALTRTYPGARFSYCLGADSFNESKAWAGFERVESNPRVDLVAVARGGYQVDGTDRAKHILDGDAITVSSTEITRALYGGDLASLRGRVPKTTFRALEQEAARIETHRRAGGRLLGPEGPAKQSFTALRKAAPEGAPDVLARIEERGLDEEMRVHLAHVQERINRAAGEFRHQTFSVSAHQMAKERGYSEKVVLDARAGMHLSESRYLHKPLAPEVAAKVEFITVLANLAGVSTPLCLVHDFKEPRARHTASHGVTTKLINDVVEVDGYDYTRADPKVLEQLMLSRWLNELVGNLDCWQKQFLVPSDPAERYQEILSIDLDEAFCTFEPEMMHDALVNHFKLENVSVDDCRWRDRTYRFSDPMGWAPGHYDSVFTIYGPLLQAYVTGAVDIDLEKVKEQVRFAARVPKAAILNSMRGFLDASAAKYKGGYVEIPAATNPKVSKADFERLFVERLDRSAEEFSGFLDRLKAAREDPSSEIHRHYATLRPRPY